MVTDVANLQEQLFVAGLSDVDCGVCGERMRAFNARWAWSS